MNDLYKKLTNMKEVRFLLVGVLNTIVGYGIYALLIKLKVYYLIANTISTILGVIHSYLWNRFYTFKSHDKAIKEIVRFSLVYLVSYLIGSCTLYLFKESLNLNEYVAGFINLFITTIISYVGHNKFSFKGEGGKNENNKCNDSNI